MPTNIEKNRLLGNVIALGLLQSANYVLPLLTIPYLVRVLGPDYFGLLSFASATIMYFVLISNYGFNLSATSQISIYREDREKINKIFSSVMIVKSMLMIAGLIAVTLLVVLVDRFSENWEVYILTFGIVIGQVLFPIWFFQGLELMKYVTFVSIFSKVLFTVLIFIFVNAKADFLLVPIFTGLGAIFGGAWSLYIIINKMQYSFSWPGLEEIKFQLRDGWHVFLSSVAISLYTVSTTFILGMLTNNSAVGHFAAVDKIIQAAKGIYQPISQSVYPLISKKFKENEKLAFDFIKKLIKIVILGMSLLSGLLFFFSDVIVKIILGDQFSDASTLLRIMAPLPLIIALSNILGIQVMLNIGLKVAFSKIVIAAALIGITLSMLLVPFYEEKGAALTLLIVEIFVTTVMLIFVNHNLKLGVQR